MPKLYRKSAKNTLNINISYTITYLNYLRKNERINIID